MTADHATHFTIELPSDREFELLIDAFLSRYSGTSLFMEYTAIVNLLSVNLL